MSTWLFRVTLNLCTDRLRRRKRNVALDDVAEPLDPTPSVADALQHQARMTALSWALAELPDRQAQAVVGRGAANGHDGDDGGGDGEKATHGGAPADSAARDDGWMKTSIGESRR